ncbi:MAG: deoxyribonuclease IV [Candidatus Brocadiia bacterium]
MPSGRPLLLGAHLSIQGGLHRAVERAQALGCTALQVFTRNNLRWGSPPLAAADAERFRAAWRASAIGPVVAHANYLVDLASEDGEKGRLSLEGLVEDLRRAAVLGIPWLVLHPGYHKGRGEEAGLRQAARRAAQALEATAGLPVGILLETTAGQGTALGWRFEHLARLLAATALPRRLGVCLDTAHAFAAGYDLRRPAGYRRVLEQLDRAVGLERVQAVHVNDSKVPLGSRVDRHAHIGHGCIGPRAFRCLLRDPRLAEVPKLLETPKEDAEGKDWDAANLAALRRLAG